jgi:hypothetical protein
MQRITTATVAANLFGAGKDGFTSGDLNSGIAPTQLSAGWCNGVQEELVQCIELAGLTPDAANNTQLVHSIPYLASHNRNALGNDLIFEWQSEETPDVPGSAFQVKTDTLECESEDAIPMCFFSPPIRSRGSVEYTIVVGPKIYGGAVGTLVFRQEWARNAGGVTNFTSSAEVLYDRNSIFLNFTYALNFTGNKVALVVTPGPGDDPVIDYVIHVKGEITILQQSA